MDKKMKINEVIVVEGHSDSAKLKSLLDCDTLETGGSSLDEATLDLIEEISKKRGIIIFTDPDYPGMQIRHKIASRVGHCRHAFVEKEKAVAHGKVGIAEADPASIIAALRDAVSFDDKNESLSWQAFIAFDIIGNKAKRLYLYDYFKLGYGNVKTLYKRLNMMGITAPMIEACLKEGQW